MVSDQDYTKIIMGKTPNSKVVISYEFNGREKQELYKNEIHKDSKNPRGSSFGREKSETPFTPGRFYFTANSPYHDDDNIILEFRTDANEKTGKAVQYLIKLVKLNGRPLPLVFL